MKEEIWTYHEGSSFSGWAVHAVAYPGAARAVCGAPLAHAGSDALFTRGHDLNCQRCDRLVSSRLGRLERLAAGKAL